MESQLHTTSDSSRLEFLYYLAIEHQNSSVDYALFDLMNSWCSLVSRQLFVASVCAESDVKSDGKLHGGLEVRLQFLCCVSP